MNDLQKLREEILKQQGGNKSGSSSSTGGDNAMYPFWNAKNDTTTVLRFLPDKDTNNPKFWVERQMINLDFYGILNDPATADKKIEVKVPCMKMYDHTLRCPVREEINKYWKTDKEDIARKYWPKRSYVMQGFVRDGSIEEESTPENPIRRFTINKSLHKKIEAAILDPEIEVIPTDYERGTDFRIIKTKQGEYADYSTSSFARRESALTESELKAIDTYGLFDLKEYRMNQPTPEMVDVIEEMFFASLEGRPYDPKWANYYKPYGYEFNTSNSPSPAQSSVPEAKSATTPVDAPKVEDTPQASTGSSDKGTADILAQLKANISKSS